ncbi:MAG: type II secretion system F family protein [Methanosarcina sp.]
MTHISIDSLAYRFFGNFFYKNKESFQTLKAKIRYSHIPVSVDQYLASAFFYSIAAGLIGSFFGIWLGFRTLENPVSRLNLFTSYTTLEFVENNLPFLEVLTSLLFFLLSFLMVFALIFIFPYFQASIRQASIDRSLLSTVTYMYALTKGGMSIYDVFRALSKYTQIFGTSAEEISYIVRDMDYLGKDFVTALETAKERTPSELFKDFIDGLILVSSGQSLVEYIKNKSEQYQGMAELANKNFLKKLDVLAEIYVTVLVAGPLFIMTTLIVLQFFRPASAQILYMFIYAIVPLTSLLYLVLLDTIGELSVYPKKVANSIFTKNFSGVPEISSGLTDEQETKRSEKFHFYRQFYRIKDLVSTPYKTIRDRPEYTFFFGIPLGLYYLTSIPENLIDNFNFKFHLNLNFAHISENSINMITQIDDYFIIFLVIVLIPFTVFYEIRAWRMRKIDETLPDFFKNLSSMNQSGILLSNALGIMAESKMGILSKELKKLKEDLSWGTPASIALMKLERNIRTSISSRMLHILIKANESTSDIKSVLSIIAKQVKSEEDLRKERASDMVVYVVTMYVSFFVFLFVVYILAVYFFPESASFKASAQAIQSAAIGNVNFNIPEYTMLMYHSAIIQAFTSGLVAGKMGQGSATMGLKYSISMVLITYMIFTMLI